MFIARTRIATAASNKLPGKSCLNVSFVPSRLVPSRPCLCPVHHDHHVHHDQLDHHDRGDHDDNGDHDDVGTYMRKGSWRLYTRKLEVVHKEVGGCLISYNLRQGSWRLYRSELIIISHSLTHSVPNVGRRYRAALAAENRNHRKVQLKRHLEITEVFSVRGLESEDGNSQDTTNIEKWI